MNWFRVALVLYACGFFSALMHTQLMWEGIRDPEDPPLPTVPNVLISLLWPLLSFAVVMGLFKRFMKILAGRY